MSVSFSGFANPRFGCEQHRQMPAFSGGSAGEAAASSGPTSGNTKGKLDPTDRDVINRAHDLRREIKDAIQANDGLNDEVIRELFADNADLIRASFEITDRFDPYFIGQIILRELALLPTISADTFGHLLAFVPEKALTAFSMEMTDYTRYVMFKDEHTLKDEILMDKVGKISEHRRRTAISN
jgi:hypothetical protein